MVIGSWDEKYENKNITDNHETKIVIELRTD